MPPLPADSIHARACKLKCEKILTRPTGGDPHPTLGQGHGLARDFPFPSLDGKMKLI